MVCFLWLCSSAFRDITIWRFLFLKKCIQYEISYAFTSMTNNNLSSITWPTWEGYVVETVTTGNLPHVLGRHSCTPSILNVWKKGKKTYIFRWQLTDIRGHDIFGSWAVSWVINIFQIFRCPRRNFLKHVTITLNHKASMVRTKSNFNSRLLIVIPWPS